MGLAMLDEFKCVAVHPHKKDSLEKFHSFYYDVYVKAFPDPNECESYENLISYIDEYGANDLFVHILLFYNDEGIAGGIIFDCFDEIKTLAIEFIVVAENQRRKGLAEKMIAYTKAYLKNIHHKDTEWTIIEIEDPDFVETGNFSYLYFWDRHNMRAIDFNYIQPALSCDQKPVDILMLCARCDAYDANSIEIEHVKKFLTLYAHHSMRIAQPSDDASIRAMFEELHNRQVGELGLISLSKYITSASGGIEA